jgi:hypothetical protein
MPGHPRKDLVREGEIGVYHTWSRCVQRAWLCGEDPVTGNNYEHRRSWIQKLLEYQASVFAIDVGNYNILSNHQHLIARTRPDIAATWSDEDVAWRWKCAWPSWINGEWVRNPTDEDLDELLATPERIPVLRANLASLSWFMARWKQPIARMANLESQTKGHFYESRFGSRELVEEGALLLCSVYVDLNQIKAGQAPTLEASNYSAIQDRLRMWRQQEAAASLEKFQASAPDGYSLEARQLEELLANCFLSPISEHGPLILWNGPQPTPATPIQLSAADPADPVAVAPEVAEPEVVAPKVVELEDQLATRALEVEPEAVPTTNDGGDADSMLSLAPEATSEETGPATTTGEQPNAVKRPKGKREPTWEIHRRLSARRRKRASDNLFLDISPEQYLRIVEWSLLPPDESAQPPPPEVESILNRWNVAPDRWHEMVENFGTWFHHLVGQVDGLASHLSRLGQQWIHGVKHCRDAFG